MNLRYGLLLPAIFMLSACTEDIADSCESGVNTAIDEQVVRPVLFMECTYVGDDVVDEDSGETTLFSGTTIRADIYLSRPIVNDGEWVGFALFDEVTGRTQDVLFDNVGGRKEWTCGEPEPGDPV